jgi:hypothetical protein
MPKICVICGMTEVGGNWQGWPHLVNKKTGQWVKNFLGIPKGICPDCRKKHHPVLSEATGEE